MIVIEGGSRAAAPKGPMTYAFTHEEISLSPSSSGWDLGLWAEIWAWGWVEGGEKIPHMCESIGHRPLRGHCPAPSLNLNHKLLQQGTGTADNLTLLRLLLFRRFCAF